VLGAGCAAHRGGKVSTCPLPGHRFHKLKLVATGRTPSVASFNLFDARIDRNVYAWILLLFDRWSDAGVITTAKSGDEEPTGAVSRNGVWVRLPAERWQHIAVEHPELAGQRAAVLEALANADYVLEGTAGELLAVRRLDSSKVLVVA
jgi:hypothetical protein